MVSTFSGFNAIGTDQDYKNQGFYIYVFCKKKKVVKQYYR